MKANVNDYEGLCAMPCDHGSPCMLKAGHEPADRHHTRHDCIFYDEAKCATCGCVDGGPPSRWAAPCPSCAGHAVKP